MKKPKIDFESNEALFHEFNIDRLKQKAAKWADKYPIIQQIILCEGDEEQCRYALIVKVGEPCFFKIQDGDLIIISDRIGLGTEDIKINNKKKYPLLYRLQNPKDKISNYINSKLDVKLRNIVNIRDLCNALNQFIETDEKFLQLFSKNPNIPTDVKSLFKKSGQDKKCRAQLNRWLFVYAFSKDLNIPDNLIFPVHSDAFIEFKKKSSITSYPLPEWLQLDLKACYLNSDNFKWLNWQVFVQGVDDNKLSDDNEGHNHTGQINEHACCLLYDRKTQFDNNAKGLPKLSQKETEIIMGTAIEANRIWKKINHPYDKENAKKRAPECFDQLNNEYSFVYIKKEMLNSNMIYPQNTTRSGNKNTHLKKIFTYGL